MTRTGKRKSGRVIRGQNLAPGRYWLMFTAFSIVVHAFMMAVMSDAALSFIQTLRKPAPPAEQMMYVSILYPPSAPLNPREAAQTVNANAPAVTVPKRDAAEPVKRITAKASAPITPEPTNDDSSKVRSEEKPQTVPDPETLDTAIRETVVPEDPDNGTIQLITGTQKTDIALSDLPTQTRPEDNTREVLNHYSSIKMTPAASQVQNKPAQTVQANPPLAPAAVLSKIGNTPRQAQSPPVPAFSHPIFKNSSGVARPGMDTLKFGEKEPLLPAPATAFGTYTSSSHSRSAGAGTFAYNAEKEAILPAIQPARPMAAPKPAPAEIITVKSLPENADRALKIKITAPRAGITDKSLVDIAGEVIGGSVNSVILSIRGDRKELLVRGGIFKSAARLDEGRNEIKAETLDENGRPVSDSIVVTYVPAIITGRILITSPVKNAVIDALKEKGILVSGIVEGNAGSVRVYLNKTVMNIDVKDGSFSHAAPLEAEQNTLYAEAADKSGTIYRSEKIAFRVLNLYPKDLAVRMEFSGNGPDPALKYRFRPHPLSMKTAGLQGAPEFHADPRPQGGMVTVGEAVPGIYTVGVEYDTGPGKVQQATFRVTLYGYDASRKKTRVIGPVKLSGKGFMPAVRVLLPEGVFWEDDYWFSGIMEDSQGTMKFKEPEGITWREEE